MQREDSEPQEPQKEPQPADVVPAGETEPLKKEEGSEDTETRDR